MESFLQHYNNFLDCYHFLNDRNPLCILNNYDYIILSLYRIKNMMNNIYKIFLYLDAPLFLLNNNHFLYKILAHNYLNLILNKDFLLLHHKKDNCLIQYHLLLFLNWNRFYNCLHMDKIYYYLNNILAQLILHYNNYLFQFFCNNFLYIQYNSYYHQLKNYYKFYNFHDTF